MFSALCGVASGITGYILGGALFHGTWRLLYKKKAQALQDVSCDFTVLCKSVVHRAEELGGGFQVFNCII